MLYLLIFLLAFVVTFSYAVIKIRANKLEYPNPRSSHVLPTPSGGGVSFVMIILAFMGHLNWQEEVSWFITIGLLATALVGFLDDFQPLSVKTRLGIHLGSSSFILIGMLPVSSFLPMLLGFPVALVCILSLTWLLNLYNFMDGLDGLASVEAISSVGIIGMLLYWYEPNASDSLITLHFVVMSAVAGFMICNFPIAKVFMGDVGSGFLGLLLGALCLLCMKVSIDMFWVWVILLGVFIVDATMTLFRRFFAGVNVTQAHCSHAYQHAAQRYGSHKTVTLGVLCINLFWLSPWALLVTKGVINGMLAVIIAYIPLIAVAYRFKAGVEIR